jgi:O-antigen/teichoic acid export membrane protein
VLGLLLAPFVALIAGWLISRELDTRHTGQQDRLVVNSSHTTDLIRFGAPMLLYAVGMSILLNLDLFLVKRILSNEAAAGVYAAAMALSQALYYMAQVAVEILFPSVGAILSQSSIEETAAYVRRWLRLVIIALVLGAVVLSSGAHEVIGWTYADGYGATTEPLRWLSWGMCFYALFVILTNIMAALGRPWAAVGLTVGLVPVSAALNVYLIPRFDLTGAAVATTGTLLAGMVGAWLWLATLLDRPLSVMTWMRIGLAAVLAGTSAILSGPGTHVLVRWLLSILVYFSVLTISQEITRNDLLTVRKLLRVPAPREIR